MPHAVESLYEVNIGKGTENIADRLYYIHYTGLGLELLKNKLVGNAG
jgi:hypothetical protein